MTPKLLKQSTLPIFSKTSFCGILTEATSSGNSLGIQVNFKGINTADMLSN